MSKTPESASTSEPQANTSSISPGNYLSEELDRGLSIVGLGRYNLKYTLALTMLLVSSIMELIGYSIVLPAAKCDLQMSDKQRGLIVAIPYTGILLTSYIHGYLIDTRGRKKMAVYASLTAGCIAFLSGLMPNLITFAICKFLTSLCIAVLATLPYTYIGEIIPKEQKDTLLSVANAIQLVGSALVPLIAWIIMPLDFKIDIGLYNFRPWRLLTMIYSAFLIVTSFLLTFGPESPKYLLSRGHPEDALKVLQAMYAGNKRKPPEDFPMKTLPGPPPTEYGGILKSLKDQTLPLFYKKYLKYLLLNGFLLVGVLSILNGIYIWVVDVLNRFMSGKKENKTACEVIIYIAQVSENKGKCEDKIDTAALMINAIAQITCAMIGFGASFTVKYIGKFYLLLSCFIAIGTCCILINHVKNATVVIILLSSFPLISLAIGPINAYAVDIFPPHLRGMAVMLSMMMGRLGSIVGSTIVGFMIDVACNAMFYMFGTLLYVCGGLVFFHRR